MIDTDARRLAQKFFKLDEASRQLILRDVFKGVWADFVQHSNRPVAYRDLILNPGRLYRFLEFAFGKDQSLMQRLEERL